MLVILIMMFMRIVSNPSPIDDDHDDAGDDDVVIQIGSDQFFDNWKA